LEQGRRGMPYSSQTFLHSGDGRCVGFCRTGKTREIEFTSEKRGERFKTSIWAAEKKKLTGLTGGKKAIHMQTNRKRSKGETDIALKARQCQRNREVGTHKRGFPGWTIIPKGQIPSIKKMGKVNKKVPIVFWRNHFLE